jgi:hypothetical protein
MISSKLSKPSRKRLLPGSPAGRSAGRTASTQPMCLFALSLILAAPALVGQSKTMEQANLDKAALDQQFLLQVNYEKEEDGRENFMTSRSRIVRFEHEEDVLLMLDDSDPNGTAMPHLLAKIPIRSESARSVEVDLNAGFDKIYYEEDRTGEDYYGRSDKQDYLAFRLLDRKALSVSQHGALLVFDQKARTEDGARIIAHYYLSRYRPDPDFRPFEMTGLNHFGFYETYPQQRSGRSVLYAMKFDAQKPIVFALSSRIPARYRDAVRDGVLYWNRALGKPLLQVIDAPPGVHVPDPDYNVIEWLVTGNLGSTSYIQSDPLTGQILHAHVFVLPETMMDGDLDEQNEHLRYIVAHEIGHALGLRHNFAKGPATTVMDYFGLMQVLKLGRDIGAGKPALPYDREVMRYVYLGESLDVDSLPPFCTDGQRGCSPFPSMQPRESIGIKGGAPTDD